jgi:hypothetical protein
VIDAVQGIGLGLLLFAAALMLYFSRSPRRLRSLAAVNLLRRQIDQAVEDGRRIHVSLGPTPVLNPNAASSLAGISALEQIVRKSMSSDRPPLVTSGDGSMAILSQDVLRSGAKAGYRSAGTGFWHGRLVGPGSFAYLASTLVTVHDQRESLNVLVGSLGPETGLLLDAAQRRQADLLAASDSLPAQAVFYAASANILIGEELFALPAYLEPGHMHQASLNTQDVLRWILIAGLLGGALANLLFNFSLPGWP